MNWRVIAVVTAVAALLGCSSHHPPAPPQFVMLGLDAAAWKIALPLMRMGQLPAWQRLVADGSCGSLGTLDPTVSVVIWTTIATGKLPEKHGITNWTAGANAEGDGQKAISSKQRTAAALWDMAKQQNRTSLVFNWWATYPAEDITGIMLTNRAFDQGLPRAVHPPELAERIKQPVFSSRELAFPGGIGLPPAGQPIVEPPAFIARRLGEDLIIAELAQQLLTETKPAMSLIYFRTLDLLGHELWNDIEPEKLPDMPPEPPGRRGLITRYYRFFDKYLAKIVDQAEPGLTIAITSDHGMEPKDHLPPPLEALNINKLLERVGLRQTRAQIGDVRGSVLAADAGIYPPGPLRALRIEGPADERAAVMARVREVLSGLREESSGRPLFENVTDGELPGEDLRLRIDLTLLPKDVVTGPSGPVKLGDVTDMIIHPRAGQHWHAPAGVVTFAGPAIARGVKLEDARVEDIAPTVTAVMGWPRALDFDGRVLAESLSAGALPVWPQGEIPSYPRLRPVDGAPIAEEAGQDEELLSELKSLGYIAQ